MPSPQRQVKGIQVSHKKYAQLTGIMNTRFSNLQPEDGARVIYDVKYGYRVISDGYGSLVIEQQWKLK